VTIYWCERAVVPSGLEERVAIETVGGRIASVTVESDPPPGSQRRNGVTLAGLANAHSHAFHRALRFRTQAGRGTFWTWREQMYVAARELTPERYYRLARAVFAEMALGA
jgi:cytosine/adenosine deaminase-related metal-dependent hydrolase